MDHGRDQYFLAKWTNRISNTRFRLWNRDLTVPTVQQFCTRAVEAVPGQRQVGKLLAWRACIHRAQFGCQICTCLADFFWCTCRIGRLLHSATPKERVHKSCCRSNNQNNNNPLKCRNNRFYTFPILSKHCTRTNKCDVPHQAA